MSETSQRVPRTKSTFRLSARSTSSASESSAFSGRNIVGSFRARLCRESLLGARTSYRQQIETGRPASRMSGKGMVSYGVGAFPPSALPFVLQEQGVLWHARLSRRHLIKPSCQSLWIRLPPKRPPFLPFTERPGQLSVTNINSRMIGQSEETAAFECGAIHLHAGAVRGIPI